MTLKDYTALIVELTANYPARGHQCINCSGPLKERAASFLEKKLGEEFQSFLQAYFKNLREKGGAIAVADFTDCGCIYFDRVIEALVEGCDITT